MRQVWLEYSEVLNETERFLLFTTLFNRQRYSTYTVINIADNSESIDESVERAVAALQSMKRVDASNATEVQ